MKIWYVNGDRLWTGSNPTSGGMKAAMSDKRKGTKKEDNYVVAVVKLEDYKKLEKEYLEYKFMREGLCK